MLITGAGGFARQLFDVIQQLDETTEVVFFDDFSAGVPDYIYGKYPVLKGEEAAKEYFRTQPAFLLGTGKPALRKIMFDKFTRLGGHCQSLISPYARVGRNELFIGQGTQILTGAIVESTVSIGKGSLLNLNVTVTHDCVIGDFCELSPGVHLSGGVIIGKDSFIGTGAVVLPRVRIGENVIVGAGACVVKDVPDNTTVTGIPARPIIKDQC